MSSQPADPEATDPKDESSNPSKGKGRATPSQKSRVAARKRPLVPNDRKEASREYREKVREERERARVGVASGDDRYLTARDKGPQRRFVRDFVDARFSVGELLMPIMLLVIIATFTPILEVQFFGTILLWIFFGVTVVDSVIMGISMKKRLAAKFGESHLERGLRWYGIMRGIMFRPMRLPKPQVRRGEYPG